MELHIFSLGNYPQESHAPSKEIQGPFIPCATTFVDFTTSKHPLA
jgi:hypothetical protein